MTNLNLNVRLLLTFISIGTFSIYLMASLYSNDAISAEFDALGRLTYIEGKHEVSCPTQNEDTAVILVIGQSLSANHASQKFITKYPNSVINFFNNKCYIASSPLLGATSEYGEFITPLADQLIKSKKYNTVIIVASGIGGTAINRWQYGGDLNTMLSKTIDQLSNSYKITDVIWQQGESDYLGHTSTVDYINSFTSLAHTLLIKKVDAPIFISISTKCGPNWIENNPISIAQNQLVDNRKIFIGVNSDKLLDVIDRTPDECHLMGSGQIKISESYANAILKYSK
jgi:hypothetical protein